MLDEITPISTPAPAQLKAITMKTRTQASQFTGVGASNSHAAVAVIREATTVRCKTVVMAGIVMIEEDGMPFIL